MNKQELADTASAMVAPGKGLLAMDESNRTCNKRFEDVGIAPAAENRRAYRAKCNRAAREGKYSEEMEMGEPALVGAESRHSHLTSQD
jgi:fructose-bisphosphate aldolase, class I